MKRPEKKKYPYEISCNPELLPQSVIQIIKEGSLEREITGYNQGRQDMIDFLPSEEEIRKILIKVQTDIPFSYMVDADIKDYTKAISKRIGK